MNTFRTILVTLLLAVAIGELSAQVEQKGVVLEYQGEQTKTPLSAVSIAAKDAGNVMSENDGTFNLQFRTLHAGSDIQMRRIEKAGYEVMNQEIVEQFRVGSKESRPIQIVMCSKTRLQQLRSTYRSVATQRYEQQLKLSEAEAERLRKEGKLKEEEYNARLDSLEEEYEDKLSKLESYIDKFARIDLSEVDAYEQQIVSLVQGGKFDDAISLYDQQDFPSKIKQSREARQKLVDMKATIAQTELAQAEENQRLRQSIDRQITLLMMAGGEENMKKVHELYHQVFLADTTHVQSRIEYATSLYRYGMLDEAIVVIQNGAINEKNELNCGRFWINLFLYYYQKGEQEKAIACIQKADSLFSLIQDTSYVVRSRYMPVVYSSFLGVLDDLSKESAEIASRALSNWEPDSLNVESMTKYSFLVSVLSDYFRYVGNHEKSVWCAREGLVLGEIMERKWPWKSDYFVNCATASSVFAYEGLNAEAKKSASQYIQLLRPFLKSKSSMYNSLLHVGFCSYVTLESLVMLEEYALADSLIAVLDEWKVFQTVESKSPGALDGVAEPYMVNQAFALLSKGRLNEADSLMTESLDQLSKNEDASSYISYYRPGCMARVRMAQGRFKEAESLYQEAIAHSIAASEENPNDADVRSSVSWYYVGLANAYKQQGNNKEYKKMLKQASKYAEYEYDRQLILKNK